MSPPIATQFLLGCTFLALAGCGFMPPPDYRALSHDGPPVTGLPILPGQPMMASGPLPLAQANPSFVAGSNRDFVWDQVVDVVDDYFRIEREQRVQLAGNVLTEGRIDTFPKGGATWFEPQRHDSVGPYNLLESTLQTIQRRALVRVIPTEGGFLVDVAVYKELEALSPPEHATAGAVTFRNDSSPKGNRDRSAPQPSADRQWIPQGRDAALEQQIIAQILIRTGALPPGVLY